jgi:nucleoside diphosphate kinase
MTREQAEACYAIHKERPFFGAHGSDGPETAAVEIAQWFSGNEIVG